MVPAGEITESTVDELAARARDGRHDHRRRQLLLPRRHPPRRGARRARDRLRRLRHQRRRLRPRARLLPDDRRPRRGRRAPRADLRDARPRRRRGRAHAGPQRRASTAEQGYLHCGPTGAGHFVKMVHNGIEYGLMAAYAEGLNILQQRRRRQAPARGRRRDRAARAPEYYQYDLDLPEVAELWRRGSVVGSWLLDLTAAALHESPDLASSRVASRTPARAAGPRSRRSTRACPRRS